MSLPPGRRLLLEHMAEEPWLQHVRDYAGRHGWLHYHTYDSRRSTEGFPDLVLCRAPRLIIAELKTDKGIVRGAQQGWKDQLEGVTEFSYFLWRPTDERIVEDLLK